MPLTLELLCDIPDDLYPGRCVAFEEYITLKEQICYDYRHPPNYRQLYIEGQRSVRENFPGRLKYGIRVDDGPLMLEYCLRALSVCHPLMTTDVDPLSICHRLAGGDQCPPETDEDHADFQLPEIRNLTPRLRLQGLACYAHMKFWADERTPQSYAHLVESDSPMWDACFAADICVGLGFVPPITLRIAGWMATTKARFAVDARGAGKFKELHYLWSTHASYLSRLQLKEDSRLRKVAKAPNLYRCANDGCEIQATNRSALRRCGGRCPLERKPHYCSESCQRQHWMIHREFCKSDTTTDYTDIVDDDGNADWVDVDDFKLPVIVNDKKPWEREWPLFADCEGPEIFIDVPNDSPFRKGEVVRLKTRTLSPECLKAYRSLWAPVKNSAKSKVRKYVEKLMVDPPYNMGFLPDNVVDLLKGAELKPW